MTDVMENTGTKTVLAISPKNLGQLASVAASAGTDDARPILTAIHLYTRDGELIADATDSYSLARVSVATEYKDVDVLIPARWLVASLKSLKTTKLFYDKAVLTLTIDGDRVSLGNYDATLTTFAGTGTFPNIDTLLPKEEDYLSEMGSFDAHFLARMGSIIPPATKKENNTWHCASMSKDKPSVWTRHYDGASALFLLMPVRDYS